MRTFVYATAGPLIVMMIWEVIVRVLGVPVYVLPAPSAIFMRTLAELPTLTDATLMTLMEATAGYAIGSMIAMVLAMLFVLVPMFERVLLPMLIALNSVPVVAFAPVALIWFGMGPASKIAMVSVAVGFAVFVNAHQGLRAVDDAASNLLRSFGAGPIRQMVLLRLPAALPSIMNGLRVAVVRSMIVAIVAEMIGAFKGLGWSIFEATNQLDFLRVWAIIAVAAVVSMTWYAIVNWIDRRFVFWR